MYNELITYNLLLLNKCFTLQSETSDVMTTRRCAKCGQVLPIENFNKKKFTSTNMGHESYCKSCRHEINMAYKEAHRKPPRVKVCERCGKEFQTIKHNQKYCCPEPRTRTTNDLSALTPEERVAYKKQYYKQWCEANVDKRKQYQENNKERLTIKRRESSRKFRLENRELCNKRKAEYKKRRLAVDPIYRAKCTKEKREYKNKRIANDPTFKLAVRLRNKVYLTLRKTHKYYHGLDLLGCSVDYARQHIENQFQPGMTWDNWDLHGWHIDHIRPIASFDLSIPSEQKKCFHYTNLQPLWCHDNWAKSDKIYDEQYAEIQ